jgi:TolA-binding protein
MGIKHFTWVGVVCIVCISYNSYGQQPIQHQSPEQTWALAHEFLENKQFSKAAFYFQLTKNELPKNDPRIVDCLYYHAYCDFQLHNRDAIEQMEIFLLENPDSPKSNAIYYLIGLRHYQNRRFSQAIDALCKVDENQLQKDEVSEFMYAYAYSLFQKEKPEKAAPIFEKLTEPQNPFFFPATYYSAYIAYQEGRYSDALVGFEKLQSAEGFSTLVPYHICQIYFLQERFDEAIRYGEKSMDQLDQKYLPELHRILAASHFEVNNYSKSVFYYRKYEQVNASFSEADAYAYGYALLQENEPQKAALLFQKSSNGKDSIAQLSQYYLGESYVLLNEPQKAQVCFSRAGSMDLDRSVQEDALLQNAKLAYQLSFDPYDDAIRAFEAYLRAYPNANHSDEAYRFLISVYVKLKKYDAILNAVDRMKNPDSNTQKTYQWASYNAGMEALASRDTLDALRHFKWLKKYDASSKLSTETLFWEAEIAFQRKNYRTSIEIYTNYLNRAQNSKLQYTNLAHYGRGYAWYQLERVDNAYRDFDAFVRKAESSNTAKVWDAKIRMGDILFYQKKYDAAVNTYQKIPLETHQQADYLLFQMALVKGYQNDQEGKIKLLNKLIQEKPQSVYLSRAHFEAGNAYFETGKYRLALDEYQTIALLSSSGWLVPDAQLKSGLVYIRLGQDKEASKVFQEVIDNHPRTTHAEEALLSLRAVDLDAFNHYARSGSFENVNESDIDLANFEQAEEHYIQENYLQAIEQLKSYTESFENGSYRQTALYYLANSYLHEKQDSSAYQTFLELLNYRKGPYYRVSINQAIKLGEQFGTPEENYARRKTLLSISEDEAEIYTLLKDLTESSYFQHEYDSTLVYSARLKAHPLHNKEDAMRSLYYPFKAFLEMGMEEQAMQLINDIPAEDAGSKSAEMFYYRISKQVEQQEFSRSEEQLFLYLKRFTRQAFWKAKGFILLGDVYLGMEDNFQAKATWQSVVDHYPGDDLKAIASLRIEELEAVEKMQKQTKDTIELDFRLENGALSPVGDSLEIEKPEKYPSTMDSLIHPLDTLKNQ